MANLTQLKAIEDLDGFLLVDKPEGIAFSTVMKTVKRKFNLVKVGHGGSLDTMASGLFIVLIGDANQFVDRVMGADREYEGEFDFSHTTDTGDRFGAPITVERKASPAEMRGDIFQTEPRKAAIRKEGAAEYEVVDTGEHDQFLGHVYRFDVKDDGRFFLKATKNVLPRVIAQDMGATLVSLRRVKQGKFGADEAVPFAKLLETESRGFAELVMPLSKALV